MKDAINNRMKEQYENRYRLFLPRRTYCLLRIDGKSFHTYCRGLNKPFDMELVEHMAETTKYLCENIQGAKLGYHQSDEISILITDFDDISTNAWFDYNLQKMSSISASLATAKFNQLRLGKLAIFDSRAFQIHDRIEVENYFIARQKDATRNSISSVAQSLYSHKELHGKSSNELQELIFQKGQNWNDYPTSVKRGQTIIRETYDKDGATRSRWNTVETPIFTQERKFLHNLIPIREQFSVPELEAEK